MLIYNAAVNTLSGIISLLGLGGARPNQRKFFRFVQGQRGITKHIKDTYTKGKGTKTVWIHAASFGEYSVARPLITELKKRGLQTVVTFFSPTGYEAVEQHHPNIDHLYYLPLDTKRNVRKFLDSVKPDKAIFIVSEYWYNYLRELKKRDIDTYLVSAKITPQSVFFKWYGALHRRCLSAYKRIFTVDSESVDNLKSLGYVKAQTSGNPLFDNAIEKAATPWRDAIIDRFANGEKVFISGSIHDERDLHMVTDLANRHHDIKFIMVPHEISPKTTESIKKALNEHAVAYSECTEETDFRDVQSIIIDHVGDLAYLYRYAQWAYIGGGFTPYLHSLLEATVYGLPVSFGPNIRRKVTPEQIATLGIGQIVTDSDTLDKWFTALKDSPERLAEIKDLAQHYVAANAGSTAEITNLIMS